MSHRRAELSLAIALAVLAGVLAVLAPGFYAPGHLVELVLANVPVLIVALGATLVLLAGEIDVAAGSIFGVTSVLAGALAVAGVPVPIAAFAAIVAGALLGAMSGALTAYVGVPSIVATLAAMVALRDALRWTTGGAWIQNLPAAFQWLGLSQEAYPVFSMGLGAACFAGFAWALRHLHGGRAIYATGSNADAARLSAIDPAGVKLAVFAIAGACTGLAAVVNAVRFNQIPSNAGLGLELHVIAAVVVGGTSIAGGRGTVAGTVLGVAFLGMVGPALTFLGASPYWEQALQGAIILVAVVLDATRARRVPVRGGRGGERSLTRARA